MIDIQARRRFLLEVFCCGAIAVFSSGSKAQVYINEVYFDPPGNALDQRDEYIELRGPQNMLLTNHYLIFVESEGAEGVGGIDNIFDLGGFTFGSNGFLTIRQKDNPYTLLNSNAAHYFNNGPDLPPFGDWPGFGNGDHSTIGASDDGGEGVIENGAFSALLIRNDIGVAPSLLDDLDSDNDGQLDVPTGKEGWTILDSVGQAEPGENNAKFYAAINFTHGSNTGGTVHGDGIIVPLNYEIEYLGRWGNSVGSTAADWHVSNLTDDSRAGFQGRPDYRQSGDPHPTYTVNINTPAPQPEKLESNQNVPYGTKLANTLGAPNFITGDYNRDGVVNTADYAVWRDTLGQVGTQLIHPVADPNHDFIVNGADYALWTANFGTPNGAYPTFVVPPGGTGGEFNQSAVPEPHGLLLSLGLLAALALRHRVARW